MTLPFSTLLAHRSVIRLGGADRRAFLQGLISNDINLCVSGQAIHAALLTPQGKFLHDLFIVESGEEFLIDCEAARAEDLLKRLGAYKLRAKVTMEDAANEFGIRAVWNPPSFPRKRESIADAILYDDPRLPELGQRVIVKKRGTPGDSTPADFSAYDRHRLALGVADGSRDLLIEKSTLAEGNFDLLGGISWTKGCYVGQELTARMHYRALVKKRLFPVRIEGAAPAFGASVKLGDEDIGDMRSHAGDFGLALLNIEKAETAMRENAPLSCGASGLMAQKPEWMENGKD